VQALKGGVDEHAPIDFIIAAEGVHQEFQVKRFGMKEVNTEALIDYLNGLGGPSAKTGRGVARRPEQAGAAW